MNFRVVILMALGLVALARSTELICEFKTMSFYGGDIKTCEIKNEAIVESNSTIKLYVNENVEGLMKLSKQEVEHLPVNLAESMPKLKEIDFEYCAISSVGGQLKGLAELIVLRLSQNRINTIADDAFADNLKLKSLELSYNKLTVVNDQHFKSLKNLTYLQLNSNKIEFVDPSAFIDLVNLEKLLLDNNKLTFIDAKTFQNLKNLKLLYLYNNLIDTIEPGSFDGLVSLESVYLFANVCISWTYSPDSSMRNALKNCTTPTELKLKNMQDQISTEIADLKNEILNSKANLKTELKSFMEKIMQSPCNKMV